MENKIRKIIRQTLLEYVTSRDLKAVEDNADALFSDVGVDIDFSDHFIDRVNDPRNGKEIEPVELNSLFVKTRNKYGDYIKNMPLDSEKVIKDVQTDINIPLVAADKTKAGKIVRAKTIMRKKDFLSKIPILKV
jgi:hypothetical protein